MDKQPENQAYEVPLHERLAAIPIDTRLIIEDKSGLGTSFIPIGSLANKTVAELRRLHQMNQELVEALKSINSICKSDLQYRQFPSSREYEILNICEALIAKHKEQE